MSFLELVCGFTKKFMFLWEYIKKKSDLVRIIKMKTDNTNKKNFEP